MSILWNTDPNVLVLSASRYYVDTDQYDYQMMIWGDGHMIWGNMEAHLTSAQMTALLRRAADEGIGPANPAIMIGDAYPSDILSVHLLGWEGKNMKEEGQPGITTPYFFSVYHWLVTGAGAAGTPFTGASAYLVAAPSRSCRSPQPWPTDTLGVSLQQTIQDGGHWVTGDALAAAQTLHCVRLEPSNYQLTLFP